MLYININDSDSLVKFLGAFQKVLGGELELFDNEQLVTFDNKNAEGVLRCVTCNGGVGLIDFDLAFKNDVCLNIDTSELNILYFIYSLQGQFRLDSRVDNKGDIDIKKFESVIISLDRPIGNRIYFDGGRKINITIIALNQNLYSNRHKIVIKDKDPLNELFLYGKENPIAFLGNYDLNIAEHIKELKAIGSNGIIRKILIENKINDVLALHLQDFLNYGNKEQATDLTKNELAKAVSLSDFIKEQPIQPHSIESLSAKNGLSPAKLQKSFKHLYGYTVSDYVRHIRLLKSEKLIKTTDLSISEIVYAVGFNSRSYFSKIFKNKYEYSPKQYQKFFKVKTS